MLAVSIFSRCWFTLTTSKRIVLLNKLDKKYQHSLCIWKYDSCVMLPRLQLLFIVFTKSLVNTQLGNQPLDYDNQLLLCTLDQISVLLHTCQVLMNLPYYFGRYSQSTYLAYLYMFETVLRPFWPFHPFSMYYLAVSLCIINILTEGRLPQILPCVSAAPKM